MEDNGESSGEPPVKKLALQASDDPESIERGKKIFYELSADTTFQFNDRVSIKVNKGMLCYNAQSEAFYQMLFGPLKQEIITLPDLDHEDFQLFLDCVMGFEPYTYDHCFKIFGIVWKYQIESLIDKCIGILQPKEVKDMNEKMCEVLNKAILYDCKKLSSSILDFVCKSYGLFRFLDNEEYCFILEPNSMFEILKKVTFYLDSFNVNVLMKWGKNYLEGHNEYGNIHDLFERHNLTQFINHRCFETTSSFVDFSLSDTGKYFFTSEEIFSHLRFSKNLEYLNSEWKVINKNDVVIEDIVLKKILVSRESRLKFLYTIETNPAVFYDVYLRPGDKAKLMDVKITGDEDSDLLTRFSNSYKNGAFNYFGPSFSKSFEYATYVSHDADYFPKTFNFKIEYTFNYNCRILLTNKLQDSAKAFNVDKMFFTNAIFCSSVHV